MKVLFLDIDGVCNCASTIQRHGSVIGVDPLMAFRIGKIQLDTGCEIVLSSAWRLYPPDLPYLEARITKFYDKTPQSENGFRGEEVQAWLMEHPEVTRYAIVDDAGDFFDDQPLFQTEWKVGITDEIAKAITDYLNEGDKQNGTARAKNSKV